MTEAGDPPAPRANPALVGHERARGILRDCWSTGRLPHAWLIAGPRGVGKATLAYRFARFVLAGGPAETGDGLAIDPADPAFRRVARGTHPNLRAVERTYDDDLKRLRTEIRVDEVRAIGRFMHFNQGPGGWRAVIIDSADDMNTNAANAILKVLEEPPPRSLFLLVSHAPGRLPATLRSRCRRLSLAPLAAAEVEAVIQGWGRDLTEGQMKTLVALGEGCPGRALELAGEGGLDLYRDMIRVLSNLPRLDVVALHGLADRLARPSSGEAAPTMLALLSGWIERLIRAGVRAAGADEEVPGENGLLGPLAREGRLDRWFEVWEKSQDLARRYGVAKLDPRQVLLDLFLAVEAAAGS